MTKQGVLRILQDNPDRHVSGEELAGLLNVSRTAVWKAVRQLEKEGYSVEAASGSGYRLRPDCDVLSADGIRRHLRHQEIRPLVYPSVSSTNTLLKTMASENAPEGTAVIAAEQSGGRGRLGRSFFSPSGSGLYLSLLLRPECTAAEAVRLTACAAVAAAEAAEELSGRPAGIKWVNDVIMGGKKVCGILTEAGMDLESGRLSYVIVGIGMNLREPENGFPEEIRSVAGAVFGGEPVPDLRNRLAAQVLDRLTGYAENPGSPALFEAYRKRSFVLGKEIMILSPGKAPVRAAAEGLNRDFSLRVRTEDGSVSSISSGEISIRLNGAAVPDPENSAR